jgi:hypothetical protein
LDVGQGVGCNVQAILSKRLPNEIRKPPAYTFSFIIFHSTDLEAPYLKMKSLGPGGLAQIPVGPPDDLLGPLAGL